MATATELAWAAGFFDGEGCVSLHLHTKKSGYQYAALAVIVVQKDRRPIDYFHALFGAVETINITRRGPKRRAYWRLVYSGKRAAEVLTALLPYLILKRDVVDVALELQRDIDRFSLKDRAAGLSPETVTYRCALIDRAKWLNSGRWAAAETKSSDTLQ